MRRQTAHTIEPKSIGRLAAAVFGMPAVRPSLHHVGASGSGVATWRDYLRTNCCTVQQNYLTLNDVSEQLRISGATSNIRIRAKQMSDYIKPSDLARQLGVTTTTVNRWARQGDLPKPLRVRGTIRWPRGIMAKWIDKQTGQTNEGDK